MIADLLELFDNESRHERNRNRKRIQRQLSVYENSAINKAERCKTNRQKKSVSVTDLSSSCRLKQFQTLQTMAQQETNLSVLTSGTVKNESRRIENREQHYNLDTSTNPHLMANDREINNFESVQKKFEKLLNAPERSEGCGKSNMKYLKNKFETQTTGKDRVLTTCYRKDTGKNSFTSQLHIVKRPKKEPEQIIQTLSKSDLPKTTLQRDYMCDDEKDNTIEQSVIESRIPRILPEQNSLENDRCSNSFTYEKTFEDVISAKSSKNVSLNCLNDDTLDTNLTDNSNIIKYGRSISENNHLPEDIPSFSTKRNSQIVKLHKIKIKTVTENLLITNQIQNPEKKDKVLDVINEMIETEKAYVKALKCVVEDYMPEMTRNDIPPGLRGQKFQVFGNIEKIYAFHNNSFLVDLKKCAINPDDIGDCFLRYENMFDLYSLYNKNKPKSDECMLEYGNFFEDKQRQLRESLNLSSQLLKPVQRLARYSLLLKSILKTNTLKPETEMSVKKASDMIIFQLRHGDDLLLLDTIKCCSTNLNAQGKLLRQEEFFVMQCDEKKPKKIRVFLFEELIVFCTPSKINSGELNYLYSMKMSEVGLTDYGDPIKFYIWYHKYYNKKYVFESLCPDVKSDWVRDISNILLKQANMYKLLKKTELTQQGLYSETRIPIQEFESDEDERTSNKQYLTTRSLRGVPGERKNKTAKTIWYCKNRSSTGCLVCRNEKCIKPLPKS